MTNLFVYRAKVIYRNHQTLFTIGHTYLLNKGCLMTQHADTSQNTNDLRIKNHPRIHELTRIVDMPIRAQELKEVISREATNNNPPIKVGALA